MDSFDKIPEPGKKYKLRSRPWDSSFIEVIEDEEGEWTYKMEIKSGVKYRNLKNLLDKWENRADSGSDNYAKGVWDCYNDLNNLINQTHNQQINSDRAECRCYKFYKGQNSYKYCPDCGRNL